MKKNKKSGFTLIEVILFLAISSAVLIAILSGTSRSLAQQRYNDAVQDVYSFLQNQYYAVINPQNTSEHSETENKAGFGQEAIYGKVIVFDKNAVSGSGGSVVNSWTVVGKIVTKENRDKNFDGLELKAKCSERDSYAAQWGGIIETTENTRQKLNATIVILRSPKKVKCERDTPDLPLTNF